MSPIVKLSEDCSVEGIVYSNSQFDKNVEGFLGIQYGTAERFERPQMSELWSGKKMAIKNG